MLRHRDKVAVGRPGQLRGSLSNSMYVLCGLIISGGTDLWGVAGAPAPRQSCHSMHVDYKYHADQ